MANVALLTNCSKDFAAPDQAAAATAIATGVRVANRAIATIRQRQTNQESY